jgi:penicillin-binding protein 1B
MTQAHHSRSKPLLLRPTSLKLISVLILIFCAWCIYLDAQVRYKFEGKRWALPAQVFARSLEIYNDKALNADNLIEELKLLGYRSQHPAADTNTYSIKHIATNHQVVELNVPAHQTPDGYQATSRFVFDIENDIVTKLRGIDSQQALYTLEPLKIGGIYPRTKEERVFLAYEEFPKELIASLLVTEDRDFNHHFGIAPLSIARAAWANLNAGRVVQGGSTLTQQLVKNFYLSRERSISRKINEALMSLMLEAHYDKQSILETYMNDVFLGQSGSLAIHGFAASSLYYFGKDLRACSIDEYALLVAMIKGPSFYNPRRYPERAIKRRNLVLSLLRQEGIIRDEDYQIAQAKPLSLIEKPQISTNPFPAFMDAAKRQLEKDYREEDLRTEGLKIYTSFDPQIQLQLEASIASKLPRLETQEQAGTLQVGAVVTATGTGELLAMAGDRQARYRGFNRALDARRPIGSLIKPAIYLSALEQANNYHLASMISDEPFGLKFENGQIWEPQNFDQKSHGNVPLYLALAKSYNLASARLGLELGIDRVHDMLNRLGIRKELTPYPSLFLGSQSLTPIEVTQFYQTIASNGFNMPLRSIREVTNSKDETLSRYPFKLNQVVAPEAIFLLQDALVKTMQIGTARSSSRVLPEELIVAGKTGTTNDNRDSWFAGYSGDYLATFWLGRDDNKATHLTGSSGALQLWLDFITRMPQYPLNVEAPKDIQYHWFDIQTANLTDERCQDSIALPIWGEFDKSTYQTCEKGYSSLRGWLKSWF